MAEANKSTQLTFNRTNLELKPHSHSKNRKKEEAFNRTNLELKQRFLILLKRLMEPFNRTNLELKPNSILNNHVYRNLLIEPIWN